MSELENLRTEYSNRIVRALSESDRLYYSKLWNGVFFWGVTYVSAYLVVGNETIQAILLTYVALASLMIIQLLATAWKWNSEVERLYGLYRKSHSVKDLNEMKDLLDSL